MSYRWSTLSAFLFCFCFCTIATVSLSGQMRGLGRIDGTVVDESGAPLAGVAVKAPLMGGGAIEATTDEKGEWVVRGIGRGEWKIEFRKEGYVTVVAKVLLEREIDRVKPIKIVLKK